jgi:hypothetical protein
MIRRGFAALLVFLWVQYACCQQPIQSETSPVCNFSEVYRKDGWTVPGVKDAKVKRERVTMSNFPGVFVAMLQPTDPETFIADVHCSRDHRGRLEIEDRPIKILDLWSFDFGGHLFAYRIHYEEEALSDGKRGELASASTVFFYDLDGFGKFTLIKGPTTGAGLFAPAFIPDWTKGSANQTPAH